MIHAAQPVMRRAGRACALALVLLLPCGVAAQARPSSAPSSAAAPTATTPPVSATRGVLQLEHWRFTVGDDPRFADPAFDDSQWQAVDTSQPLTAQGIDPYSGYAWYRLRLSPQELAALGAATKPMLLLRGGTIGETAVYINGLKMGVSRGMSDHPAAYSRQPLLAYLPEGAAAHPLVIAVRTWVPAYIPVRNGVLSGAELGSEQDISLRHWLEQGRLWNQAVTAGLVLSFLFLCVGILGAALYVAQRNHPEYLWLCVLCTVVACTGVIEALFQTGFIPLETCAAVDRFIGHIFMAVTLEFVYHFTGVVTASRSRRLLRAFQAFILIIPFLSLLPLGELYGFLAVGTEIMFCIVASVLLYRGWRRGQRDAGVMLLPFFLAATGHSADSILSWLAELHWISAGFGNDRHHLGPIEFGTGTLAYAVFLASLIAVILYRFIRVSQDEQRSSAEIAAARSVQAMLIPTQLPSSRNFMVESAYLPVNGVGGDFFQVLPLKDDSLLIVVGDVSGKGLQAAMNSSSLVGALRNELSHEPATVLEHLNRVLLGAGYSATDIADACPCFATCLCARVYPDGTLVIANAGHLGPYRDGRELELPPGLPLGVIPGVEYESITYHLEQGERLVFLSDGVVEAANAQGDLFGFERTQQVSHESARYIAQTAKHFGQTDDITVVSLYMTARSTDRRPAPAFTPA